MNQWGILSRIKKAPEVMLNITPEAFTSNKQNLIRLTVVEFNDK